MAVTSSIVKATSGLVLAIAVAAAPGRAVGAAEVAGKASPRAAARRVARHVRAQVAARMPATDPAVQGEVARAIVIESSRAGVDPLLVVALIHVESTFDPRAVSSAGAAGLMQLREPTMRAELERAGLPLADPLDPVASVQAGVRYLRRLIAAFGELDTALMAYNAGPGRILGHLRKGAIPERFRSYPRKVQGELERVRRSLEDDGG